MTPSNKLIISSHQAYHAQTFTYWNTFLLWITSFYVSFILQILGGIMCLDKLFYLWTSLPNNYVFKGELGEIQLRMILLKCVSPLGRKGEAEHVHTYALQCKGGKGKRGGWENWPWFQLLLCQALCPALQMHDLIFCAWYWECHVCFESPGPRVPHSELSAWHLESQEWEEMSRWIFLTLLEC